MAILKRDVNFGLLLIIIATLVAFSGFSTYYQKSFRNLSERYDTKINELDNVMSNLQSHRKELNQTSFQLQVKAERETELSGRYTSLKEEKNRLLNELAQTQEQLAAKKRELTSTQSELTSARSELDATRDSLTSANVEITSLRASIDDLEGEVSDYQSCIVNVYGGSLGDC